MLMICWFYCIPFAKGLYFASGPLLILFSLFALKRGIRQARPSLRRLAFLLMFVAAIKMFTVDVYLSREYLLCRAWESLDVCTGRGAKGLQAAGLGMLMLSSLFLFHLYRRFVYSHNPAPSAAEQSGLSFWANLSMSMVVVLIVWLAAPWVGYLTVGRVPDLFMQVPWQHLAVLNIALILYGFWRLEDFIWLYNPVRRTEKKRTASVWTPKDTLWLSVILFLVALAFSYVSNDVLARA